MAARRQGAAAAVSREQVKKPPQCAHNLTALSPASATHTHTHTHLRCLQFILLTIDDAVYTAANSCMRAIASQHKNPNGCQVNSVAWPQQSRDRDRQTGE